MHAIRVEHLCSVVRVGGQRYSGACVITDGWRGAIVVHWGRSPVRGGVLSRVATVDGWGAHILLLMRHCLCNRRNNLNVSKSSIEMNDGGNWMIERKDNKLGAE
jgi:hypothetical protein